MEMWRRTWKYGDVRGDTRTWINGDAMVLDVSATFIDDGVVPQKPPFVV